MRLDFGLRPAILALNEWAIPSLRGVFFVRQLTWSCLGIMRADKMNRPSMATRVAEGIEALASWIAIGRPDYMKGMTASRAIASWVSGYTRQVDWLTSTFLDLMLVESIFVPQHGVADGRSKRISHNANDFYGMYEQTIRQLGFSALSTGSAGEKLYPPALR